MSDFCQERMVFSQTSFIDASLYLQDLSQDPNSKPRFLSLADPSEIFATDFRTYRGRAASGLLLRQMLTNENVTPVPSFTHHALINARKSRNGKEVYDWKVASLKDGTPVLGTGVRLPQEDAIVLRRFWIPKGGLELPDFIPTDLIESGQLLRDDEWLELPNNWPVLTDLSESQAAIPYQKWSEQQPASQFAAAA